MILPSFGCSTFVFGGCRVSACNVVGFVCGPEKIEGTSNTKATAAAAARPAAPNVCGHDHFFETKGTTTGAPPVGTAANGDSPSPAAT